MAVYKCCWNCIHGLKAAYPTKEATERAACYKRFCYAPFPVFDRTHNPFKRRYCKQFEPHTLYKPFVKLIDKTEAEKLNGMNQEELVKYWGERR